MDAGAAYPEPLVNLGCTDAFGLQGLYVFGLGLRPLYFPSAFASAMPSRWRSSMMSRLNAATPPSMASISWPVGVLESMPKFRMRRDAPNNGTTIACEWRTWLKQAQHQYVLLTMERNCGYRIFVETKLCRTY